MKALKIPLAVFLLAICMITTQILFAMEKKNKEDTNFQNIPKNLYEAITIANSKFVSLTTKVQFTFAEGQIKNRGGLVEIWTLVFYNTLISPIIHKHDSALLAQVDITFASKKLKKHFKHQIQSKTIRQIIKRKLRPTGLRLQCEQPGQKCSFIYKGLYGLGLISAGWIGKSLWDAGGKKYAFLWGNYLLHQLFRASESHS